MTNPDVKRTDRARAMERDARALSDDALEERLADAHREVEELRQKLEATGAWREAIEAERDRRSVQRRAI